MSKLFLCEISFVCRLKCPYNCFSSNFCFLVIFILLMFVSSVLWLMALTSLPPRYFMWFSCHCIDASTLHWELASSLPPSFLGTYTLSTWCKALCIVMSFLVLRFICLCFSLVHFKNGLEDLTRETASISIPLRKFLLCSLVSSSFLFHLRYSFCIFLTSPLILWCPFPKYL